jgi:hypothetical protein
MNITPEEIADGIVEILEGADGQGIIITDKRLAESNSDSLRLLKSQVDADSIDMWRGWEVSWTSIGSQVAEGVGGCDITTIYIFTLKFSHLYQSEMSGGITSEISFQRAIYYANEAFNKDVHLGIKNGTIDHQGLESSEDFHLEEIDGGSVKQIAHVANFTLRVLVLNTY